MNPNPVPAQGQAVVPLPATTPSATPEMTAEPAPTPSPTATSEVIADEPTPQVAPRKYWALTNLIAAVVTVLICLITCLTYFRKNSHDDEEDEENDRPHPAKFLTLIPAILSIFLFTLTEDMRLPWKWVDKWTLWMILLLLAAVILAVLTRNRADRDNAEEA